MTEQKKTTIKDFISIAMLSAALVFGLTHMPSSADDQSAGLQAAALQQSAAASCGVQLADVNGAD